MRIATLFVVIIGLAQVPATQTYDTGARHGQPLIPTVQSQLPNKLLGVTIESWRYDPQDKIVILHLMNNSGKDVTAFNISIAEKYADGSTSYVDGRTPGIHDHQMMQDMLLMMVNLQMGRAAGARLGSGLVVARAGTAPVKEGLEQQIMSEQMRQDLNGSGTFAGGTSRDYIDHVSKDVSDIEAAVDVVAYADGTAQVLDNERGFKQMMAERKGQLLAMQKVTEVVEGVLADPMVTNPFDDAVEKLAALADSTEKLQHGSPEDPESNAARHLQSYLRNFQAMQKSKHWSTNMTDRDWLQQYVDSQQKRIELMKPHCELAVEK